MFSTETLPKSAIIKISNFQKFLQQHGRFLLLFLASLIVITITAILMLLFAFFSAFQGRRFNTEVIAKTGAISVLRIWGVRLKVHQAQLFSERQTVYISNHISSLDPFIFIALGLPNTRYFIKGYVRKHVPFGIVAYLTGTFFTVPQEYPEKRRMIFERAEGILRRTRESVFLTPEGKITLTGEIGPFNKGAFHLATALAAPITPLYIQIPRETDPGDGFDVRAPGTVHVYVLEPIPTDDWNLETLEVNRDRVRDLYVQVHENLKPSRTEP